MRFKDRVVLITGGSQGIGRAYALAFAQEGAAVVIADINGPAAETVAAEITATGGRALAVTTDVSDEASTLAMAQAVLAAYGRIDILLNNAAIFSTLTLQSFDQIAVTDWDRMFAVNTRGVFLCARAVAPSMQANRYGKIINMSSVVVDTGRAGYAHYVASKAAVVGLTRVLATELGPWDINVNAISPHGIATEVPRKTITEDQWAGVIAAQAIRKKGGVDDMIGIAMFLASDDSRYISGQTIGLNAGAHYN
ncbi:MAG TPA: SDR family oxidoreductase [Paenirhodobacter sp.]